MLNTYWKNEIAGIDDDKQTDISYNMTKEEALELSKQIMALNEDKKEVGNETNPEIERLTKWRDSQTEVIDNRIERLTERLLEYYQINKSQNKDFKLKNPYVHISDSKKTTWNWTDEKETISSLKDNDQNKFITTKETIDKNNLKKNTKVINGKVVTEDGTILEGVTVTIGRNISLKVEKNQL